MFLLTNKALIWVGKGQKRKAHHHHDVGYTGEVWYQEGSAQKRRSKHHRAIPGQALSLHR